MKYTEYTIDNDKIEFLNSIFGKEKVVVNGEKLPKNSQLLARNIILPLNQTILSSNQIINYLRIEKLKLSC